MDTASNREIDRALAYPPHLFGPLALVVLQGTPYCNLNCSYCYLPEESRRRTDRMSPQALVTICRNIFSSAFVRDEVQFSWHAGEPTTLKPSYYRACIEAVLAVRDEVLGADFKVTFDMQTNATLISDEWCDLFEEFRSIFSVGVSCDGPEALHDLHRRNWSGRASHAQTEAGLRKLCDRGIRFDITSVVSPETLKQPDAFLEYFAQFNDYIDEFHYNLHDDLSIGGSEEETAYAQAYGAFVQKLLTYISSPAGQKVPKIRNFTSFYNRILVDREARPDYDARAMAQPLKTLSVEANGDATTLYAGLTQDESRDVRDLYGDGKGFCVGNLLTSTLDEIAWSNKLQRVIGDFEASHRACEASCSYFDVCSGGYNLIKFRRAGRFDISETPECRVHVQTFADVVLDDLQRKIDN